jgi:hypothetical protein
MPAEPGVHARINNTSNSVPTSDTTKDPAHPRRRVKKKNTRLHVQSSGRGTAVA